MSVLKSKRGLSKMEFYHNARKLRRELTEFLRRDFGVHSRKNASKINPTLPDDWYDEDIVDFSKNIRILLRNLVWNITAANTINASSEKLVEEKKKRLSERRGYQNAAIINCQQLIQEFQFCEDSLPITAEKLLPYVESINFEITLLKGWRKSDNKLWEQILAEEKNCEIR
nr:MAG TPA: Avd-like-generating retroelement protein [Caudoviricetes sp.]